jgi:UDP-2,3-diacylglucosamine hydrolase
MRIFLSDLHLEDAASPRFRTFATVMRQEALHAEAIYVLGDLTEVWVGDDDDAELATELRSLFSETTAVCPIYLMHGNRDFLFGTRFAADTGVELIKDPLLLEDGTLLAHGDSFCIDDHEYQNMRALFRSPDWQAEILAQSLAERRTLAQALRAQSKDSSANKAENIMDVAAMEVARVIQDSGAKRLIHGHTHRPGVHNCQWGRRTVLGAWERCGWLARQRQPGSDPQLECFPLS